VQPRGVSGLLFAQATLKVKRGGKSEDAQPDRRQRLRGQAWEPKLKK